MDDGTPLGFPDAPRAQLDRVLAELVTVAQDVLTTQGRLRALLRANQAVVQQLELPVVLQRIVDVAAELVGAEYAAIGVIDPRGGLEQFFHVGMTAEDVEAIGHLPEGHGLIGAMIDDPRPIRLRHLSEDPRSFGFPAGHPAMDGFLGVPVRVRDRVFGNLYLTNPRSGQFSADDEELVVALAATAGFAVDNARLFTETKQRQAWMTASAEITAALLSTETGDPIDLLASRVLALSGAQLVCVVVPTEDPEHLLISTAQGDREDELRGIRFPAASSAAASVIEARQPRILQDETEGGSADSSTGRLAGPTMAVPLIAAGRALGVLLVSRRRGGAPYTGADLEVAADFAGRASVAMKLAEARADRQHILLMEDRGRIARDLHDHVIQQLFVTGLELQSVVGSISSAHAAGKVAASVNSIDAVIAQIRTAIFALAGAGSDSPDSIRHQIIDVINSIAAELPRTPQIEFSGPVDLIIGDALASEVTAVVREALTNVVKHARAQRVVVRVAVEDGTVLATVVDDGVGAGALRHRSGLANLEARALRRGGSFSFTSGPGHTAVVWSVPVPASDPQA